VLALALAGAVACTQSPEAKKQKAVERAESFLKEGKANEAIIELRNALQIDKDYVPALRALGRAYAAKAWYGDAIRELSRAQKGAPDSVPIAIDLGRAQVESGGLAEAEKQANFVLSREPQNAAALHIRAATRLGEGKADEALTILDGIVRGGQSVPGETAPLRAQALT
jgi:tetratricopeptide (TPR) repeat protein